MPSEFTRRMKARVKVRAMTLRYKTNAILFSEGDDSKDMYILLSGSLRAVKDEKIVAKIEEPGTYIGEVSALLGLPRTATLIVNEAAELIHIPPEKTEKFFTHSPDLALKLAKILAHRLRTTTNTMITIKNKEMEYQAHFEKISSKIVNTFQDLRNIKTARHAQTKIHDDIKTWVNELKEIRLLDDVITW